MKSTEHHGLLSDWVIRCSSVAKAVASSLPIEVKPNEWGDEFYFEIPVRMPLDETAATKVSIGR